MVHGLGFLAYSSLETRNHVIFHSHFPSLSRSSLRIPRCHVLCDHALACGTHSIGHRLACFALLSLSGSTTYARLIAASMHAIALCDIIDTPLLAGAESPAPAGSNGTLYNNNAIWWV
jgi:hypothetical protein